MAGFGWSEGTWTIRLSQILKWLGFCNENDWAARLDSEGDVISYVGYFSIDGKLGPVSVRHDARKVSRYHKDCGFEPPTKAKLVKAVLDAYYRNVYAGVEHDTCVCAARP